MTWSESPIQSLVIPQNATDHDARITLAEDSPLADFLNTPASITLYGGRIGGSDSNQTFLLGVQPNGGDQATLLLMSHFETPNNDFPGASAHLTVYKAGIHSTVILGNDFDTNKIQILTAGAIEIGGTSTTGISMSANATGKSLTLTATISAAVATITGAVTAASATLSGAISAASATISGVISAASATISGAISAASMTLAGLPVKASYTGSTNVSVSAATSTTVAVTFSTPFVSTPSVSCFINSGAGGTARWHARPISVTNTGFTIFAFSGDNVANTWSAPVLWTATGA